MYRFGLLKGVLRGARIHPEVGRHSIQNVDCRTKGANCYLVHMVMDLLFASGGPNVVNG